MKNTQCRLLECVVGSVLTQAMPASIAVSGTGNKGSIGFGVDCNNMNSAMSTLIPRKVYESHRQSVRGKPHIFLPTRLGPAAAAASFMPLFPVLLAAARCSCCCCRCRCRRRRRRCRRCCCLCCLCCLCWASMLPGACVVFKHHPTDHPGGRICECHHRAGFRKLPSVLSRNTSLVCTFDNTHSLMRAKMLDYHLVRPHLQDTWHRVQGT